MPAMSRTHTGEGSASIRARSDSMSPASLSWRAASSANSRFTPLTSRSRSTARPPMARPSASIARPASVINCMVKASPCARSASVARSMACALSASSQLPNASTRWGTGDDVTRLVSPVMSGSLSAAPHDTRICGSDSSSAFSRSPSFFSVAIWSRSAASVPPARIRVRTRTTAVVTANSSTPSVSAIAVISCRSSDANASRCARKTSRIGASARAGAAAPMRAVPTMKARNPLGRGWVRRSPRLIRIVSGMPDCPCAGGVRATARESLGL